MNKERLLNVAKALRESPDPDVFDMGEIFHSCGTPSCAFGHYVWRTDLQDEFEQVSLSPGSAGWAIWSKTKGRLVIYERAVAEHFDLTEDQSNELFDPGCGLDRVCETHLEAANYIENFVKEHA